MISFITAMITLQNEAIALIAHVPCHRVDTLIKS